MKWWEIQFQLLDDPMIESGGCDGLLDARRTLIGLSGMYELQLINKEFILKALNASIDARNNYCSLNGAAKLPHVTRNGDDFQWEK